VSEPGFDIEAAWLRRFSADVESNLTAFALRLKEAMPELVTVRESKTLFSRNSRITAVSIDLGEYRYGLEIDRGRLKCLLSMVVRGIVLNTKDLPPSDWFAKLLEETHKMSEHAEGLSQSLSQFMGS
jgi:hypothetical protein